MEPRTKSIGPLGEFLLGSVPLLALLASVWAEAGPYAWVAVAQLKLFGSYGEARTFVIATVLWIVLWVVLAIAISRIGSAPGPAPVGAAAPSTSRGGWIFAGLGFVAAALTGVGVMVFLRPLPPRTLTSLGQVSAAARFWPCEVKVALKDAVEWVDEEHRVGVKRDKETTYFLPVHAKGATRVDAVCVGSAEVWQHLGEEGTGTLTLEPIPLLARRAYAEAGLEAPLFAPVLRWGSSPVERGLPWVIAGVIIGGITAYLWHGARKRQTAG